jgi:hypothetical protein
VSKVWFGTITLRDEILLLSFWQFSEPDFELEMSLTFKRVSQTFVQVGEKCHYSLHIRRVVFYCN